MKAGDALCGQDSVIPWHYAANPGVAGPSRPLCPTARVGLRYPTALFRRLRHDAAIPATVRRLCEPTGDVPEHYADDSVPAHPSLLLCRLMTH